MTREEQIALAQRIAQALPEVTRNEWMRWLQMAESYGLEKAIQYAERVARDITVRPAIQRSNRLIAKIMRDYKQVFRNVPPDEQRWILGWVSWWLSINYSGV